MKKTLFVQLSVVFAIFSCLSNIASGMEECDMPPLNPEVDRGVFLWKNCETDVWNVRVLHGGRQNPPRSNYYINVTSDTPFQTVTKVSLEGRDEVLVNENPAKISFSGATGSGFQDGIEFTPSPGAISCFLIRRPSDFDTVKLGQARISKGKSVDLETLMPCARPSGDIAAITAVTVLLLDDTSEDPPEGEGTIGDFVWDDLNKDGIQDRGEPGHASVIVNLLRCSNDSFLATTETESNGYYAFSKLRVGRYKLEFILPPGFKFSPRFAGAPNSDSNVIRGVGKTACVEVRGNESKLGIDAGLVAL